MVSLRRLSTRRPHESQLIDTTTSKVRVNRRPGKDTAIAVLVLLVLATSIPPQTHGQAGGNVASVSLGIKEIAGNVIAAAKPPAAKRCTAVVSRAVRSWT